MPLAMVPVVAIIVLELLLLRLLSVVGRDCWADERQITYHELIRIVLLDRLSELGVIGAGVGAVHAHIHWTVIVN